MTAETAATTMGPCVRSWAPGRVEIAGNHVDHQGGCVIAAAIDRGIEATVQARLGTRALIESEGFDPIELALDDVSPKACEQGTTASLVRGVVAGLRARGIDVGGFLARVRSDLPVGGGLSSSAAFELSLCQALAVLFGGTEVAPVVAARIGQAAERDWFGKPCGLMDQLAVACGGMNLFDFGKTEIGIEPMSFDFERAGLALVVIDTHCDHSRYTEAYAQVAKDMAAVAHFLGVLSLRHVSASQLLGRLDSIRDALGDVPALRALHYQNEMALVDERARALRSGDVTAFIAASRKSGASSAQYLQNVSTFERSSQPAMVVLAVADLLLGNQGAARIHGGGFGGTVVAYVPEGLADAFARGMDAQFGAGSAARYRISPKGAGASMM